ncbi:hypothetical protein Tco_1004584 [Tanacetum coccineum]|uniref:Uncharacterized protein n=1 Tax=Tanacetum coccineum TaxID=301880 RepID=A0ABQ5FCA6_9ASTR
MVGTATTIDDRPRTRECDNSAHADNRVACEDNYSFGMENDLTQGAANIIYMANGDEESSYSKNLRVQETVVRKALPALKRTLSGIAKQMMLYSTSAST